MENINCIVSCSSSWGRSVSNQSWISKTSNINSVTGMIILTP
jgi:hypothetical protein